MATLLVQEEPAARHTGSGQLSAREQGRVLAPSYAPASLPAPAPAAFLGAADFQQQLCRVCDQWGCPAQPQAATPSCTPHTAGRRSCRKVQRHQEISSYLEPRCSCRSRKVLEAGLLHRLRRGEIGHRKKKNDVLLTLPSCKLREGEELQAGGSGG